MDVFTPSRNPKGIGVIWVVSGGWFSSHVAINPASPWCPVKELTSRGYTVFAVVHGSQPKFTIEEIVPDLHKAVRFIRYHAADYGIAPGKIGITGMSAGGHLSLMQGMAGNDGDPKAADPVDQVSSRVQAVACFVPPTDFLNYGTTDSDVLHFPALKGFAAAFDFHEFDTSSSIFRRVKKQDKIARKLGELSPVTHVTSDDPPTLVFQGDKDPLVPLQQSERLMSKLKEAGVPCELVVRKDAAHSWPGMPQDIVVVVDWFDKYLQ